MLSDRPVKQSWRFTDRTLLEAIPLALILTLFAANANARDGAIEISQAGIVATGGFPFSAFTPGDYILTSNLIVPENTNGIFVGARDVTLDLGGFSIRCEIEATGEPCAGPATSGSGIFSLANNIEVRNGTIRGFGQDGVSLVAQGVVRNLRALRNGRDGVRVGDECVIEGVAVLGNGEHGISVGNGCTVHNTTAARNGLDGIRTLAGGTLVGNAVLGNGDEGMECSSDMVIQDSLAFGNGDNGISVGVGSMVSDTAVNANGGTGIQALSGSQVQRNAVADNVQNGLILGASAVSRYNTVTGVGNGATISGGINGGGNVCNGSFTCAPQP